MPDRSERSGLLAVVLLTAVATVLMYSQRAELGLLDQPASVEADSQGPIALEGFRGDAGFLPDDGLLGFVEIPRGRFLMGSDPIRDSGTFDNERWTATAAQGTVDVPTFYIGRYEVTVAQFRSFVEETGLSVDRATLRGLPDHPVGSASWPEAIAYTRWLDASLRAWPSTPGQLVRLLDDGWHVSLPTEVQWEKAARGSDGRIYPWGNDLRPDRANYENSGTRSVGSFACPECVFDVSDMSGNVWELTRSPYQPYPYDPANDLDGLDEDALWVMRGGSYADPARNIRCAIRGGADPGARRPFIGFRVVITRIEPGVSQSPL